MERGKESSFVLKCFSLKRKAFSPLFHKKLMKPSLSAFKPGNWSLTEEWAKWKKNTSWLFMGTRCKQKAENILRQFTSLLALHEVKWFYCNQGFSERSIDVLGRKLDIDFSFTILTKSKSSCLGIFMAVRALQLTNLSCSIQLNYWRYSITWLVTYLLFSLLNIGTLWLRNKTIKGIF